MESDATSLSSDQLPVYGSSSDAEMRESENKTQVNIESDLPRKAILRQNMLEKLAQTDAHFKHQQRGDPDLSAQEKVGIAGALLDHNAAVFLSRFSKYLTLEDIEYFSDRADEYEIKFHLDLIRKENSASYSVNLVRNRRYEAMKQLIKDGEYFSDDTLKHREPYLYHQMIGQYLSEEEAQESVDKSDMRFSTILLKHMDQIDENRIIESEKDKEEGQMEEEEEESDEDFEDDMEEEETVSESRKIELKQEFYKIMEQRFLMGQDHHFDYSEVDNNAVYDNLDILDKDEEEKYFDAESSEEESVPNITSMTGVLQLDTTKQTSPVECNVSVNVSAVQNNSCLEESMPASSYKQTHDQEELNPCKQDSKIYESQSISAEQLIKADENTNKL